jgi:hypothetical protein
MSSYGTFVSPLIAIGKMSSYGTYGTLSSLKDAISIGKYKKSL